MYKYYLFYVRFIQLLQSVLEKFFSVGDQVELFQSTIQSFLKFPVVVERAGVSDEVNYILNSWDFNITVDLMLLTSCKFVKNFVLNYNVFLLPLPLSIITGHRKNKEYRNEMC